MIIKPVLFIFFIALVNAQYYGSGGDYGGGYSEGESRPKLQLGLRVRIPAMKFELPRMSLPKITISAKIRQPQGPRTINLPEINLDTSSREQQGQNGAGNYGGYGGGGGGGGNYMRYQGCYGGGGGGYGAASNPSQHVTFSTSGSSEPVNYGYGHGHGHGQNSGYGTQTQTFSLSSEEEPTNNHQMNNYNNNNNNNNYNRARGYNNQQRYNQYNKKQMRYSSSNIQPIRTIYQANPTDRQFPIYIDNLKEPLIGYQATPAATPVTISSTTIKPRIGMEASESENEVVSSSSGSNNNNDQQDQSGFSA